MLYIATAAVVLSKLAHHTPSLVVLVAWCVISIFSKTLLHGVAQTLAIIFVTNASPDPYSLATIVGFMQCATVFKGLVVAMTAGMGASVVWDASAVAVAGAWWVAVAAVAVGGSAVAYYVVDRPRARDYGGCLKWEVCYDCSSEDGLGEGEDLGLPS